MIPPPVPVAELRSQWAELEAGWAEAVARAESLDATDEQVDGEWSVAQTLRHLVFATDKWLRHPVLELDDAYWHAGLVDSACPDEEIEPFGVDRHATPTWDEVVAVRADRQAQVRSWLQGATDDDLGRTCAPSVPVPDTEPGELTVWECIFTVVEEEEAHLGYANRDLDVLAARR